MLGMSPACSALQICFTSKWFSFPCVSMDVGMSLQGTSTQPCTTRSGESTQGFWWNPVDKTNVETFIFLWLAGCVCRKALLLQIKNYPVSLSPSCWLCLQPPNTTKECKSPGSQLLKLPSWRGEGASLKLFRPKSKCSWGDQGAWLEVDLRGEKPGQGPRNTPPSTVSNIFLKCAPRFLSRVKARIRNLISSTALIRRNIVWAQRSWPCY